MNEKKRLMLFGLPVVTVGVILNAYQMVVELRIIRESKPFDAYLFPANSRFFLLLCLLLTGVGLAIGRRWSLVASALVLLGVAFEYINWWHYSHRLLELDAEEPFSKYPEIVPPSLAGLLGARWWDLFLLVLLVALLIWEIRVLVKGVRSADAS
jgi:hypothetical protein